VREGAKKIISLIDESKSKSPSEKEEIRTFPFPHSLRSWQEMNLSGAFLYPASSSSSSSSTLFQKINNRQSLTRTHRNWGQDPIPASPFARPNKLFFRQQDSPRLRRSQAK